LCAKCHDLSNILSNASFAGTATFGGHSGHIKAGFSCSVCHTSHGMGATSSNGAGVRMVNFDLGVVARNDTGLAPVSYVRGGKNGDTCTLKCHNYNHNSDGSVTLAVGGIATPSAATKH
jgi:hypothetical protein